MLILSINNIIGPLPKVQIQKYVISTVLYLITIFIPIINIITTIIFIIYILFLIFYKENKNEIVTEYPEKYPFGVCDVKTYLNLIDHKYC